jgi:hypothetical protein
MLEITPSHLVFDSRDNLSPLKFGWRDDMWVTLPIVYEI